VDDLVDSGIQEEARLGVFRFAWFAMRTFFGVLALILVAHAAMWLFVRVDSMSMRNADPNAALERVKSYNAQVDRGRDPAGSSPSQTSNCRTGRVSACRR
jgi:hypothetical protein